MFWNWRKQLVCDEYRNFKEKMKDLEWHQKKRAYVLGAIRIVVFVLSFVFVLILISKGVMGQFLSSVIGGFSAWILMIIGIYLVIDAIREVLHKKDKKTTEEIVIAEELRTERENHKKFGTKT